MWLLVGAGVLQAEAVLAGLELGLGLQLPLVRLIPSQLVLEVLEQQMMAREGMETRLFLAILHLRSLLLVEAEQEGILQRRLLEMVEMAVQAVEVEQGLQFMAEQGA